MGVNTSSAYGAPAPYQGGFWEGMEKKGVLRGREGLEFQVLWQAKNRVVKVDRFTQIVGVRIS